MGMRETVYKGTRRPAFGRPPPISRASGRAAGTIRGNKSLLVENDAPAASRLRAWLVVAFVIFLGIPWVVHIGPMRMSAYRIFLCLAFVPCLIWWLRGKAGGIKGADVVFVTFSVWIALSIVVTSGSTALQSAGIVLLETLTPYLLARCCIRNAGDFQVLAKALFWLVVLLLPLIAIETVTGWKATLRLFGVFLPTYGDVMMPPRVGLWRAQGPFDHPILLGLVCSSAFTLAYLVIGYGKTALRRYFIAGIVAIATACSLSSGPLLGILLQVLLMCWKLLADWIGLRVMWIATIVSLSSAQFVCWATNRSLLDVTISRLTFDPLSYWFRNVIWQYGWSSVLAHPWLGVGLGEWDRPYWMPGSIDNVWLYFAVKHGLPALFLIGLSVTLCLAQVGWKQGLNKRHRDYRCAYLVSVISCCLVGLTVHFWDGAYVLIIFLLGSGLWIVDVDVKRMVNDLPQHGRDKFGHRNSRLSEQSQARSQGNSRPRLPC